MLSPLITTGTAGGQDTVAAPQILPKLFFTVTVSCGAKTASQSDKTYW